MKRLIAGRTPRRVSTLEFMRHKEGAYDGWENARAPTRKGMTTPDEQEDRE